MSETNKKKSNEKFKKAVKKQSKIKGLGGTTTDVNQSKAESMRKKGRRAGPIEKGVLGAAALLATRGKFGKGSLVAGAKEVGKKIFKTTKDVGSVAANKSKTQPVKGGEYRMVARKPPKKPMLSGISKRSTQTGKGIRSTPKPIISALAVSGAKKKDNVVKPKNVPTPRSRPISIKPKKKGMFMKESSGLRKDDNKKLKDSKVKFKSEVIKRKK